MRELYDVCMQEQFQVAYDLQVDAAFLYRLFIEYGISGFKVISQHLGRDVGTPRVPLDQLNSEQVVALFVKLVNAQPPLPLKVVRDSYPLLLI